MRLLLIALLPLPALAARPGEDGTVTTLGLAAGLDTYSRHDVGFGVDARVAIPVNPERAVVPDVELRGTLLNTRLPPKNIESFIRGTGDGSGEPIPDDAKLDYAHWQARVQALASWGATSRELGLRARVGGLFVVDGDSGAVGRLGPYGWEPDYTAAMRLGLTGAAGIGVPLGDEIGDPLLDLRLGGSLAAPIMAGGGRLADDEFRDFALTVDDQLFEPTGFVGREARVWGEATAVFDRLSVSVEIGLEHTARSAISRARAESDSWDWVDEPAVAEPHGAITVGWVF